MEPGDRGLHLRLAPWGRAPETILFGCPPSHEVPSPCEQSAECLGLRIRQRPGRRPDCLGTVGEGTGLERIRLRQLPCRFGKSTRLARIDNYHGQRRRSKGRNHSPLVAPCRCEDDQRGLHGLKPGHEGDDPRVVIGDGPGCSRGAEGNVSLGFGHIHTDKTLGRHTNS
jgi:hypothetical protein